MVQAEMPDGPGGGVEPDQPPRGWMRLLLDRAFGLYVLGRLLSSIGIWIYNIVAVVLAFDLSGSAFVAGLVSVAQFLPQLVLAPVSGALADRGDRKRQAIVGRVIVFLGCSGFALWLQLVDADDQTVAVGLVVSALVVGVGFVTGGPAMHAMVPSLVHPSELAAAVTLNTAPVTIARAVGPAVGTWIALLLGPAAALHVAGACSLGFAIALLPLRIQPPEHGARAGRSVRSGFAHVWADRTTAVLLVGVAVVGMGADPAITLAPAIAAGLGEPVAYTGTLATAFGVGAGVAFMVIPSAYRRLGIARSSVAGLLAMAGGLAALVPIATAGPALVALGISGLGMTVGITSLTSSLQQRLPEQMRGRVMALWSMAYLGSRPIAAAVDGAVADAFSVSAALLLVVTLLVGAAYFCRPGRLEPAPEP